MWGPTYARPRHFTKLNQLGHRLMNITKGKQEELGWLYPEARR
jgi:hypothetical protein